MTANFFPVIGLAPQLGRAFSEEEDRVGGPALVVISDRLWERIFQRDPAVLPPRDPASQPAIHRHRRDAGRDGVTAGNRRVAGDDAALEQRCLALARDSSHGPWLGAVQARRVARPNLRPDEWIAARLDASRGRIIRQLLIESAPVAMAGGALGFLFALWSRDTLVALGPHGVECFAAITFDARVLGFGFLAAAATTVLFGLWPAWNASRSWRKLQGPSSNRSRLIGTWLLGFLWSLDVGIWDFHSPMTGDQRLQLRRLQSKILLMMVR